MFLLSQTVIMSNNYQLRTESCCECCRGRDQRLHILCLCLCLFLFLFSFLFLF